MVSFRFNNNASYITITHNVILSIYEELKNILRLPSEEKLIFLDIDEFTNKKKRYEGNYTKVGVRFSEKIAKDHLYLRTIRNYRKPILQDRHLVIKPIYLNTNLIIGLKIVSKSKGYIYNIKDKLTEIYLEDRTSFYHNVLYRYYLNRSILPILHLIYNIKVENECIENDFNKWLAETTDSRATVASTQAGYDGYVDLLFKESQGSVYGEFLDLDNIDITYNKNYYGIELKYKVNYTKVSYFDVSYPITVCGNLLPEKYIRKSYVTSNYSNGASDRFLSNLDIFTQDTITQNIMRCAYINEYLRVPIMDSYITLTNTYGYMVVASFLVAHEKFLLNLAHIDTCVINEYVLSFLLDGEWRYITEYAASVFYIQLFKDGLPIDGLSIDNMLNVYYRGEFDKNSEYRLLFLIAIDKNKIKPSALDRFNKFRDRMNNILRDRLLADECEKYLSCVDKPVFRNMNNLPDSREELMKCYNLETIIEPYLFKIYSSPYYYEKCIKKELNIEWVHKQILNPVYINLKAPEETIKKILESESIFNIDIENGLTDLVGKYQNQLTTAIMKTVQVSLITTVIKDYQWQL
jgi:hypothetical protein